ncbi:hypothetical protein Tco_1213189 [Tanacetum coccineum]
MDSRECSGVSIVCIEIGKIAQRPYMGSSKGHGLRLSKRFLLQGMKNPETLRRAARKDIEAGIRYPTRDMFLNPAPNIVRDWVERCDLHVMKTKELRDRKTHNELRKDLVGHLWNNDDE